MQSVAVSVEVNLLSKRARVRNERRGTAKDETSLTDIKIDNLAKSMERLMDRTGNMERKPQWDNQKAPPIRNPNFRNNQNIGKNEPDRNIRPHFQENYAETSHPEDPEQDTQINLMGINDKDTVFLTQDEQELYMLQQL